MSLKNNYLNYVKKLGGHQYVINKNIKKSTIDSLMQGCDIGISKAYEIAKALGITVEELYIGEKKKPQDNEPLSGIVNETQEPYCLPHQPYSWEERHYISILIEIMRGANQKNAGAIKENLEAFHNSKDMPISTTNKAIDCEPNDKKKRQSC